MTSGRNLPCFCGSGRKYKNCCLGREAKPRATSITMDMGVPVDVRSFSVSPTGHIQMFGDEVRPLAHISATVERSYERPKGAKVLSRVPLTRDTPLVADPNSALLQFDTIFAVDTNTRTIRNCSVSVAAITLAKWKVRYPEPTIQFATRQAMEFRDVDCHPDLLALQCFLKLLESTPGSEGAGNVAIVMDSHLGDLPKIQSRQIPILDDYFLPDRFTIVYATDAANDALPNVLLRRSDKAANELLRKIEDGEWWQDSQVPFSNHSNYFRVWSSEAASAN